MLMVIVMITGDFLAMSLTTDRVRHQAMPELLADRQESQAQSDCSTLLPCVHHGNPRRGRYQLHLRIEALQTLIAVSIVFGSQANHIRHSRTPASMGTTPQHLAHSLP